MIFNPHQSPYCGPYDDHNPEHRAWLDWWLDQPPVPVAERPEFYRDMHGRKVDYFNLLIRGWREREAKRRPF